MIDEEQKGELKEEEDDDEEERHEEQEEQEEGQEEQYNDDESLQSMSLVTVMQNNQYLFCRFFSSFINISSIDIFNKL